jgi:hypothetical protein
MNHEDREELYFMRFVQDILIFKKYLLKNVNKPKVRVMKTVTHEACPSQEGAV